MKIIFNKKGFTLLELIVCVFIISLGLVGVLSLVVQNVRAQYLNKNVLIASQLAQEGLELTRNIRDTNWLSSGSSWNDGLTTGNYKIDYSNGLSAVSGINEAKLYINASGFYDHVNTGTATIFKRLITTVEGANTITITCLIEWEERNATHKYSAQTILYNWR